MTAETKPGGDVTAKLEERPAKATRNTKYYLDSVTFKVEDQLFKVPKYRFMKESEVFQDMFSLPQGGEDDDDPWGESDDKGKSVDRGRFVREGGSDDHPIVLEGIQCIDFERFLEILYPLDTPPTSPTPLSLDTYRSTLTLATMWSFRSLRTHCISQMRSLVPALPSIEKILLARRCRVRSWLIEGYDELIRRKTHITESESLQLGQMETVRLYQERERCRKAGHEGPSSYGFGLVVGQQGHGASYTPPTFGMTSSMGKLPFVPPYMGLNEGAGSGRRKAEEFNECSHHTSVYGLFAGELSGMVDDIAGDEEPARVATGGDWRRLIDRSLVQVPDGMQ